MLGFSINYGQLKRPDRRAQVEGFFRQTCQRFMHLLPSTTGSHPGKGRSDSPEENAQKYQIDVEEAEQVLDVFVAAYNITPRRGHTFSLSPVEIIDQYFNNDELIFPRLLSGSISAAGLGSRTRTCVIRGRIEKGGRPYIQLDKARYTSPELAGRPDLIGKKVLAIINPKDYRILEIFHLTGELFGTVRVQGIWSKTRHSITTRKLINGAIGKRVFECALVDDVVLAYRHYLESKNTKSTNLELQHLLRELSDTEVSHDSSQSILARRIVVDEKNRIDLSMGNTPLTPGQLISCGKDG